METRLVTVKKILIKKPPLRLFQLKVQKKLPLGSEDSNGMHSGWAKLIAFENNPENQRMPLSLSCCFISLFDYRTQEAVDG